MSYSRDCGLESVDFDDMLQEDPAEEYARTFWDEVVEEYGSMTVGSVCLDTSWTDILPGQKPNIVAELDGTEIRYNSEYVSQGDVIDFFSRENLKHDVASLLE